MKGEVIGILGKLVKLASHEPAFASASPFVYLNPTAGSSSFYVVVKSESESLVVEKKARSH